MRRGSVLAACVLLALTRSAGAAPARGLGWHGHSFHHHRHPPVVIGGSVFWDPFFFPGAYYPYYVPYPVYAYPPPDEPGWGAPPPDRGSSGDYGQPGTEPGAGAETERAPSTADEAPLATYGLVQLRGIPDGTAVDLDGRFWLTAMGLDQRWLALPQGAHRLMIRVEGADPVERRIDVAAGKNQVVRLGPLARSKT